MKTNYSFDHSSNTLTVNEAFLKAASRLDTPEYKTMLQLRKDFGSISIVIENPSQKTVKAENRLTFTAMKQFICKCRNAKERLVVYENVCALSKAQRSPYHYVKKWFLDNYANYSATPDFDEEGFVIVKTRAQMEAEKAAAASAAAAPTKSTSAADGITVEAPLNEAADSAAAAA